MRVLTHKGVTWHDDPAPSEQVLLELQEKYGFHELDIEDCLSEHERPKVEEYDTYLFLVFHIPYRARKTGRIVKEEVNIFMGQDFFVTRERIRQIEAKALRKLRHPSRSKLLKAFVD